MTKPLELARGPRGPERSDLGKHGARVSGQQKVAETTVNAMNCTESMLNYIGTAKMAQPK